MHLLFVMVNQTTKYCRLYLKKNIIPICPMTKADILRAKGIFGTDIGSLQEKTTHKKTKRVHTALEDLPAEMLDRHGNVTLEINIMYLN